MHIWKNLENYRMHLIYIYIYMQRERERERAFLKIVIVVENRHDDLESTTILNACKKCLETYWRHHTHTRIYIYIYIYIYITSIVDLTSLISPPMEKESSPLSKENSEFKPVKLRLQIDLLSFSVRAEGLVNINITPHGPDDHSVGPKRYSFDFLINLSSHLDYLCINFPHHTHTHIVAYIYILICRIITTQ